MSDGSTTPRRIQRKRTKGWRMPEGAIYVGRGTQWGNPFAIGNYVTPDNYLWPYVLRSIPGDNRNLPWSRITITDPAVAAEAYGWWFIEQPGLMLHVKELAGRDLCCWCRPENPCHADFLLAMANDGDVS